MGVGGGFWSLTGSHIPEELCTPPANPENLKWTTERPEPWKKEVQLREETLKV